MQPINDRWIDYLLAGDIPKQEMIAATINERFPPGPHENRGLVSQSDIARWRHRIPKGRIEELGQLVDEQIWKNLACDHEPVYLCNISETYGKNRERSARRTLRQVLRRLLPPKTTPGSFALYIMPTRLSRGVHAQTFANNRRAPSIFIILVEESRKRKSGIFKLDALGVDPIDLSPSQQDYILGEIGSHVLNGRAVSPSLADD